MDTNEIISAIALTRLNQFTLAGLLELYRRLGSASAVVEHHRDVRDILPDATPRLVDALSDLTAALDRAKEEFDYDQRYNIEPLLLNEARYPQRLKDCADAPLVLFYKGNAELNRERVINIVGTRHCTSYGQDIIRRFVADMKELCPGVLIVSGLAYGVDICAHRNALDNGLDTVGVLAHGLDDLYPPRHRDTAVKMLSQGGLLTEHLTRTNADKINFVRRNRIVAGMCDATILIESAAHGGGLITTRIAQEYGRDVFAFPGRVGDEYSAGTNNLIRDNGAQLITSAEDFVNTMGWQNDATLQRAQQRGIEREMFPDLNDDEKKIVAVLRNNNDLQVNVLSAQSGIAIGKLSALLFTLEMKGVLKAYAGGVYHLLNI